MKLQLLLKQFISYSTVGFFSIAIDAALYIIISDLFIVSKSLSKIISFIAGSVNSFIGNKIFTFRIKSFNFNEPVKFFIVYSISLIFNSLTHDFFLEIYDGVLPFLISTIVSIIINFFGQKLWVFNSKK